MGYSRNDVIIWDDDERLRDARGRDCWLDDSAIGVLKQANDGEPTLKYHDANQGFIDSFGGCFPFLIFKDESKERLAPLDLSDRKDRDNIRGRWIRDTATGNEFMVLSFHEDEDMKGQWYADFLNVCDIAYSVSSVTAQVLLEQYVFLDNGRAIGKEVDG